MRAAFWGSVLVALCGEETAQGTTCQVPGTNNDQHIFVGTNDASNTTGEPHPFYVSAF